MSLFFEILTYYQTTNLRPVQNKSCTRKFKAILGRISILLSRKHCVKEENAYKSTFPLVTMLS